MSIIKDIREAIIVQAVRSQYTNPNNGIARILVDADTYCEILKDPHFRFWGQEFLDERDDGVHQCVAIMGHPIVPSHDVKGFDIMLDDGTLADKAEKGTAQN